MKSVSARKLQINWYSAPLIADQVRIRAPHADAFEHRPVVVEKLESTGVRAGACDSLSYYDLCDLRRRERVGECGRERLEVRRALNGVHGRRTGMALGLVQLCPLDRLAALTRECRQVLAIVVIKAAWVRKAQRDHTDHLALPIQGNKRDRRVPARSVLKSELGRCRRDSLARLEVADGAVAKDLSTWIVARQRQLQMRA